MYDRCDDGLRIIVKSINLSRSVENSQVERMIENLMNLRHPCIRGTIGVVIESPLRRSAFVGMYCGGSSLSAIISASPEWWTPTAKAKAIVGIVLGLRFGHSLGLLHGNLTGDNISFNEDGMIQISDFCLNDLRDWMGEVGGFSGANWSPKADVQAFSRILSEIAFEADTKTVPLFVNEIIERGQSTECEAVESFADILKILKQNDFEILEGVNIEEVTNFVSWIESTERLIE
jgi:serine/threonine protein kinase